MRIAAKLTAARGRLFLASLWLAKPVFDLLGLRGAHRNWLVRLVERTRLFDGAYYLEHHPDIADLKIRPVRHYVAHGDREGRLPMAFFDPVYYRARASGPTRNINALLHYAYVGRYERISPSPWFNVDFYLRENIDVARSGMDPLFHYVTRGGLEGRSPSPEFDGAFYLKNNPDVMRARINPLLHYLVGGRLEGRRIRPEHPGSEKGHEPIPPLAFADEASWQGLSPRDGRGQVDVDVIVPVYKGRAETLACLHSVLTAGGRTGFELIVIDDASPEPDLVRDLRRLAEQGLLTLVSNTENLGFVGTVNRGIALHKDRDVVLLNSDTEVYDNWLDRLRDAARRHSRTATVTPLSNNATICSYPRFLHDNPYPLEISYPELDRMAAEVNARVEVEAPSGVGFCIYIRRDGLNQIGPFDREAFGKGYGEENDFCQRAIALGWRNVIAADVFVRHWGAASFLGAKAKRIKHAMKIMDRRHPNYKADVMDFIQRDPLVEARARLDWARLLRLKRDSNVLIVCHNRGGGTERHVQEDSHQLAAHGRGVFFMRPVRGDKSSVVFGHPALKVAPNLESFELRNVTEVTAKLRELGVDEIHTHSLVDYVPESPTYIRELVRLLGARWEVNLHDYKVICPRINLADENGRYCGEPNEDGCSRCLETRGSSFDIKSIKMWRNMHWQALEAADKVLVPDEDVEQRLSRYFPGLEMTISPHEVIEPIPDGRAWTRSCNAGEIHVVVIGAIGKLKGIDVLLACARDAMKRKLPLRFSVLGYTSNDGAARREGIYVTGRYHDSDATDKLAGLSPDIVWLPSVWPETYSYTLSIALKGPYPVAAFDIGAIANRLRKTDRAQCLMPLALADDPSGVNDRFLEALASTHNSDKANALA